MYHLSSKLGHFERERGLIHGMLKKRLKNETVSGKARYINKHPAYKTCSFDFFQSYIIVLQNEHKIIK